MRLPGIEDRSSAQLSGGQAQRVALARALIGQPQVLLLDEPLAALDLKLRKAMQLELRRIQEELGTSFLYVTHDQEEALTMSDRIVLMNEGRIVQEGSPAEIYDRPATVFASGFIGEANLLRGTVAAVDGERARVRVLDSSLEVIAPARGIGPDRPVVISVRPERLRVGRPGAANGADNRAPGYLAAPHLPRQHRPPVRRARSRSGRRRPDRRRRRAATGGRPGGSLLAGRQYDSAAGDGRVTVDAERMASLSARRLSPRVAACRVRESERPRAWMVQLLPATVFLLVFLVGPVAVFFVYSFWTVAGFDLAPVWNLDNYRDALGDEIYRSLFVQTIATAALAAAITTVIAYTFAHAIRFHLRRYQEPLLFLVVVALFSGYLVRIYAWRTILGDEGVINTALLTLGIVSEPLSFLLFSRVATTITLVNFLVPLAVLPIYAALQNVRDEEIEVARDLGASAAGAFRRVTLPLAWGGVFAAFALTLIIAAGDYVTPQLVGGTSGAMIGRSIASTFGTAFNWPLGAALSFLTLAFVLAILGVLKLVSGRVVR